jgi:hypothetical protein
MDDIGDIIRKRKEQLRSRLIEIYDNGDKDTKDIICLLVQTEYECAIRTDNYNRVKNIPAHNADEYSEKNKELMEHCWLSEVGK